MRSLFILALVFVTVNGHAQKKPDNAELVNEFTKVMSFGAKEYISYVMVTKVASVPVMLPEDTITTKGMFYKNGNNMYSGNELEETYFQDSFYIRINHTRKTIWVNKASQREFEKLTMTPVSNAALKKLTGDNFSATKTVNEQEGKLVFETTKKDIATIIKTNISLTYNNATALPSVFNMQITMQQPWTEEIAAELKASGIDDATLIHKKEKNVYWMREQSVTVTFENINTTKEAAMSMPLWTQKFAYDPKQNKFTTKGAYSDYEITQLL